MYKKDECFEKMILNLEPTYNLLFRIGLVSLLIMTISKYIICNDDVFILVDALLFSIMLGLYFYSFQLKMKTKVLISTSVLSVFGLFTYFVYGIEGTGFGVILIANIITGIFADKSTFRHTYAVSVVGLVSITAYKEIILHNMTVSPKLYIFQIFLLFVCIELLRIGIRSLRTSLLEKITELDDKLDENRIILNELQEQNIAIKTNEKEIYQLAYYDQLTNLPMKNLFRNNVESLIRKENEGTLILVDIKDFKLLNSVYGSQIGDQLLKIAGEVLLDIDEPLIHSCRISGNDFALWYSSLDTDLIKKSLNTMLLEFNVRARKIFMYNKVQFYMAYAQYPEEGDTYIELYNKSVIALNYSKVNKIVELTRFTHEMETLLHEENHLKELIEDAIQRRAFNVHYQEKYDSKTNRVIGLEALARWHSDKLGNVPPSEFIPIITKYQLVGSFERLIIGKVFSDYKDIVRKYGKVSIGINISPEHIVLPQFIKYFEDAILLYRIDPTSITLEITEEVMINGMDHVKEILDKLKLLGLKISLDDFGSGYSSLNYLAKIPFDEIKIDKSFVDEIEEKRVQTILKAIIEIKNSYNIQLIAEGVETEEQLKLLQDLGCYNIQGYLFSKPKALSELQL